MIEARSIQEFWNDLMSSDRMGVLLSEFSPELTTISFHLFHAGAASMFYFLLEPERPGFPTRLERVDIISQEIENYLGGKTRKNDG